MKVGLIGAGRWTEVHRKALQEASASLHNVLVSSDA